MPSSNKSNKMTKGGGRQQQRSGGTSTVTTATPMRKGPWTEEEDAQLVWFVRLFGERRWDFLAKVSGLKRTGKSCRLRWVNYLHPGLRHGRITADEERLIVELHAKWGTRWSRIARSLPGRTDNEIKNFWRTRVRKQKQALGERPRCSNNDDKSTASPSSSTTSFLSASPNSGTATSSSTTVTESAAQQGSSGDDDEPELDEASTTTTPNQQQHQQQQHHQQECYTMDQLWNEIAAAEAAASYMDSWGIIGHAAEPPSPVWEFCSSDYYSLWRIDDDE